MKRNAITIAGSLILIVVVLTAYVNAPRPPKPPKPKTVFLPADVERELLPFAQDNMAGAAETWAGVLGTFADFIEQDGTLSTPRIRRVADVRRIRDSIVKVPIQSVPGGDCIGSALAVMLESIDVGELTEAKRKTIVNAFRSVANYLGEQ